MTEEPAFVAETLAWCNERRAEKRLVPLDKLPKGRRGDGYSCPCGKATGLFVTRNFFGKNAWRLPVACPDPVSRFVRAFDHGELPQYEEAI